MDEKIDHKKDYKTTYNDPMKQKEADIIKAGTTEKYSFSVKAVFIFVVGLLKMPFLLLHRIVIHGLIIFFVIDFLVHSLLGRV